ncbi:MAG: hypothetical protein ACKO40_03140, partial [Planctomycetaceae bacterium]
MRRTPNQVVVVALVATLAALVASPARAQATRTWSSNGTTNVAWLTTTNWATGTFAGNTPNAQTGKGAATDIMAFLPAGTGVTAGINMNTISGSLGFAGIDFTRTGNNAFQIGNSSSTVSGTLQLNGGTINSVANTLIRANSGNLTITNVATGATNGGQILT